MQYETTYTYFDGKYHLTLLTNSITSWDFKISYEFVTPINNTHSYLYTAEYPKQTLPNNKITISLGLVDILHYNLRVFILTPLRCACLCKILPLAH